MAGKKQIHNINSHQIRFVWGWGWGWGTEQRKLCYMEMETEHVIHVINSHSIHMWDIWNITVFWEISYKSYGWKYIKI